MPFSGAGSFAPYTPGNPVVSGTTISSSAFNNTIQDIATGLGNTVTRDGQSPPTADLPMASHKLTGLAAGSSANDSVRFDQIPTLSSLGAAPLASPTFTGTVTAPTLSTTTITGMTTPLSIAQGGTGSATQPYVDLTTGQTIAGVKTFSSQPVLPQKITLDTAKALSGSSSTFTGIPSWVNRITVSFIGVSTNGVINVYLQLGSTAGGIAATGYGGSTSALVNAGAVSVVTPSNYAAIGAYGLASASFSGIAVISRISSTSWSIASTVGHYANNAISTGAYAVDIANVLDRIQLATTDTFDAGSWNILYE